MRDTVICTVGTSLFTNLRGMEAGSSDAAGQAAQEFARQNWVGLAQALRQLNPADYLCGAEINSIASLVNKDALVERQRLLLLVSDTDDGAAIGRTLELYFRDNRSPLHFNEVECRTVQGLSHADSNRFRREGLRNLVREVANEVQRQRPERVAINATGGYKAQIAFAAVIGQALQVPVYYMFERFAAIIELPPQPVALDMSLWLERYELFHRLDRELQLKAKEFPETAEPRLAALLDFEPIDGELFVALSAMGQLFHEQFSLRFALERERLLPPPAAPADRRDPGSDRRLTESPHLRHMGFQHLDAFLRRVFDAAPYVVGFRCWYTNPDLALPVEFMLAWQDDRPYVKLTYSERGKSAFFEVETTAEKPDQLRAAVADLKLQFAG